MVGKTLVHYGVQRMLGRGGWGDLYLARDMKHDRNVALKVGREAPEGSKFFETVARTAGRLEHENIVRIYDSGKVENVPYIVMELLEGEELPRKIRRGENLALEDKIRIIHDVCKGLAHAHSRGVIHMGIMPRNIFITASGCVKILGFGEVQADMSPAYGMARMKYCSPEQLREAPMDARSDIYSVGTVLYELLTGQRPYDDAYSVVELIRNILDGAPLPFDNDTPPSLAAVVSRCRAVDPADRYPDIREVAQALRSFRSGQ